VSAGLPVFRSLVPYRRTWLRGDLIAGITVWAVLVPEALAYASIAGVSPVVGLYAAPGALILYAALGSSGIAMNVLKASACAIIGMLSSIIALPARFTIPDHSCGVSSRRPASTPRRCASSFAYSSSGASPGTGLFRYSLGRTTAGMRRYESRRIASPSVDVCVYDNARASSAGSPFDPTPSTVSPLQRKNVRGKGSE
jgi:Sulfate permease family